MRLKAAWSSLPDSAASHTRHVVRDIVKDAARTDRGFVMFGGANNVWLEAMVDVLTTWTLNAHARSYSQVCLPRACEKERVCTFL